MSLASLERSIAAELATMLNNPKIRVKDIQEWSTGSIKPQSGEMVVQLPSGVYVATVIENDKRAV